LFIVNHRTNYNDARLLVFISNDNLITLTLFYSHFLSKSDRMQTPLHAGNNSDIILSHGRHIRSIWLLPVVESLLLLSVGLPGVES
jgi:hypothetical protein